MILQAAMDERNPPAPPSAPFFWPFSKSSGNLAALLNPAQGSSLENVVTSAAAAAAAAAANAAVAAVFSAAGMPNPANQERSAVIRPEPSLAAPKNSPGMEEMRQSTTQSLLDTLQAALNSQKEEATAGVEKDGNLELQPNLGLSLDSTRSQSSTQNAFLAAFQAANGATRCAAPDGLAPPNARSEGKDALLTKLQLALKASSKRDEGGAGPVHAERDLMSALDGPPRVGSPDREKKNDQVQHSRRAALWEEACEEEERGVGVAAVAANGWALGKSGSGFGRSGSGYSSNGGGSGVIWPDQDGQVADPIELSKRSASIAWPEDGTRKKETEPWLARLSGHVEGKLDAAQNGTGPSKGKVRYDTEQHRAEQALRTLAQMAGGRDRGGATLGPSPPSFSLSLGDIQQLASPSGGKSNTAIAPLTLATASLRRLLGLGPLQSPDAGKGVDAHLDRNGGHADGRPEDDAKSPFELNPLLQGGASGPASVGGASAAGTPTVVGFKRERLESIERYKEKRRRRQLNVTESKQSDRSDEEDGGGGDEPKKGAGDEPNRSPTPPRMRGPMPSLSPKAEERSMTPPPSREGSPGVTVAQPAGGRRRRLAQLPLDEAKAKNVMAHRASAARSNAKKKAALERVQRLEAMLGPVRAALIGACERDDELKQLLLKRAGSRADALSKFVDGEQSLDDLLQATSIKSKK